VDHLARCGTEDDACRRRISRDPSPGAHISGTRRVPAAAGPVRHAAGAAERQADMKDGGMDDRGLACDAPEAMRGVWTVHQKPSWIQGRLQ
jgi:hypothetical protein